MVVEYILNFIAEIILNINKIELPMNEILNAINQIRPVLSGICYYMPIKTVTEILAITTALLALRIVVALLHTLWKSLPLL